MTTRRPDHVCCFCSRRHKQGAKTFQREGNRCAKNCTRKPITVRPFPWVGKGACAFCGATVPRGTRRCKNRATCAERALGSLKVLRRDDAWVRREYEIAMGTYEYPAWARARQEEELMAA